MAAVPILNTQVLSARASASVAKAIDMVGTDRGRLMDVVQHVQADLGYLPVAVRQEIATGLGIHLVEVEDMISFYAFLNTEPRGKFHIRLSRTPVSLFKGAVDIADAFVAATGAPLGGASPDGLFTVEWTSDIGMADQEPAALLNGLVLTNLTPSDAVKVVETLREHADTLGHDNSMRLFPGPNVVGLDLPGTEIRSNIRAVGPVILSTPGLINGGLYTALLRSPEEIILELTRSRLRGRGGAGFPTGMKWKLARQASAPNHHVVCNADEGEPGTFKDRVLLTDDPDLVFDGMTIAGFALGARQGVVYLRGEYAYLHGHLQAVLARRRSAKLLGKDIGGLAGFDFDIRIQLGAGAYICGEESSLIESLEGKRGAPRDRPPFPTDRGYRREPTAVDNVETFACVARIMEKGAEWFSGFGTPESAGTKLLSVSGDCPRPGIYEVPFGITVNGLLDLVGAPEAGFVQMGGPSGQCVAPKDYGRRIAFEDLPTGGSVIVFGPNRDVIDVARQFTEFFVDESCGWCTPCRVGTTLLKQGLDRLIANRATLNDVLALQSLAGTVMRMSRCGLGQSAANPILTTMRNFPELYEARLRPESFVPRIALGEALVEAAEVQGRHPILEEETL